jgi:putative membrane protein
MGNAINVSPAPSGPSIATELAHERTDLVLMRSYFASERTLMAWIRTALSMISFGFTLAKLGQAIHDVEVKKLLGGIQVVGVRRMGYFLVVMGTLALLAATVQHWHRARQFHAKGLPRQISVTYIVALVLVISGFLVFTSLIANI